MEKLRSSIILNWLDIESNMLNYEDIYDNLKELFMLYDEFGFDNQISTKLKETGSSLSFSGFLIDEIDVNRWCDVLFVVKDKAIDYDISLSPWIVARIIKSDADDRLKVFGTSDIYTCLLITFEHQLSHLLALLWGHFEYDHKSSSTRDIYGVHGKLYNCATTSFFGEGVAGIVKNLETPGFLDDKSTDVHAKYEYWENSCNLDSLNMLLFTCKNSFFRTAMFTTNSSTENYIRNRKTFKSPCTQGSYILTEESFRNFVSRSQAALIHDYIKISTSPSEEDENNGLIECYDIRNILSECYTNMKNTYTVQDDATSTEYEISDWDFYNVGELYALYTDMFPSLKVTNTPATRYDLKDNVITQTLSTHDHTVLTFWDFIHDEDPYAIEHAKVIDVINWDAVNHPFLVFKNGGIPAITKFGITGIEIIKDYANKNIEVFKHRSFGETILNGKYEMVGALILEGTSPGEEGGVHYHACIKTSKGWFYYNDNNARGSGWRYLKKFPASVLREKHGRKPEMYFYVRI